MARAASRRIAQKDVFDFESSCLCLAIENLYFFILLLLKKSEQRKVPETGMEKWPRGDEKAWEGSILYLISEGIKTTNSMVQHIHTSLARRASYLDNIGAYQEAALSVPHNLLHICAVELERHAAPLFAQDAQARGAHLSLELLMGCTLYNTLYKLGFSLEDLLCVGDSPSVYLHRITGGSQITFAPIATLVPGVFNSRVFLHRVLRRWIEVHSSSARGHVGRPEHEVAEGLQHRQVARVINWQHPSLLHAVDARTFETEELVRVPTFEHPHLYHRNTFTLHVTHALQFIDRLAVTPNTPRIMVISPLGDREVENGVRRLLGRNGVRTRSTVLVAETDQREPLDGTGDDIRDSEGDQMDVDELESDCLSSYALTSRLAYPSVPAACVWLQHSSPQPDVIELHSDGEVMDEIHDVTPGPLNSNGAGQPMQAKKKRKKRKKKPSEANASVAAVVRGAVGRFIVEDTGSIPGLRASCARTRTTPRRSRIPRGCASIPAVRSFSVANVMGVAERRAGLVSKEG
ncbi:hypothetical protein L226DRAFT_577035 [Lentinus tigrinus ALCF2SS1-7]|uniref:uncharacterized protein n=1 Tax=Lentinus tigrinus ALCF2SS1-7 TaxID=1328758 RepID=UPI00116622E3|nr:hypothetical protein L226DRAFT_577035 [Lentinus tigrinus ALCF2SS1-7]